MLDVDSFAQDFANGYLFAEILAAYNLQVNLRKSRTHSHTGGHTIIFKAFVSAALDFVDFSTAEAKLNNFLRIEPTMRKLSIPFDANTVRYCSDYNTVSGAGDHAGKTWCCQPARISAVFDAGALEEGRGRPDTRQEGTNE